MVDTVPTTYQEHLAAAARHLSQATELAGEGRPLVQAYAYTDPNGRVLLCLVESAPGAPAPIGSTVIAAAAVADGGEAGPVLRAPVSWSDRGRRKPVTWGAPQVFPTAATLIGDAGDLSDRVVSALEHFDAETLADVAVLTADQLLELDGFGEASLDELVALLGDHGLSIAMKRADE